MTNQLKELMNHCANRIAIAHPMDTKAQARALRELAKLIEREAAAIEMVSSIKDKAA